MVSRYGLVGLFCALLNVAIVGVGTEFLHLAYVWAAALTCPITIPLSYGLHRSVSFEMRAPATLSEFWRFVLAQLSQFALGLVALAAVVEATHWRPWIAMTVVSAAMMVYGFLASSAWVFRIWHRGASAAATASRAPLRVLQVSAFFPAHGGGIEVVAGQLARRLAAAGVEVTWMAGGPPAERPAAHAVDAGAGSLAIDQAQSIDFVERRLGLPAPLWSLGSLRRLWRHVGACDVVQVHDYLYMPTLLALLFARLRRRRVLLTQHVGEIAYESRAARGVLLVLNHTLGRVVLGGVSQVVFVGRPVMDFFGRIVRYRNPPLLVANGVDHDVYHPSPSPGPASDDPAMRVLFVGRFVEKKGLGLLRECVSVPGIRWAFAGRGPLSPERWDAPAGTLEMLGVLPPAAVADAMRAADVLVLPSHGEGFPLVVQEALACGTPVLVSQEVADAFPVTDPHCVWAVDVAGEGAADRLRAMLAHLAADVAAVRAARPGAVALARQWSWDGCVASYLAIYADLRRR